MRQCTKKWCSNEAAPDRKQCPEHLEYARLAWHRRKERDSSLCQGCLLRPRREKRRTCERCGTLDRSRAANLKQIYGLSLEEYDRMFQAQSGRCWICAERPNGERPLAVDHDHVSGKIRGLLCHACNCGLGFFRDSADRLGRAIEYLSGHPGAPESPSAPARGALVQVVDIVHESLQCGREDLNLHGLPHQILSPLTAVQNVGTSAEVQAFRPPTPAKPTS